MEEPERATSIVHLALDVKQLDDEALVAGRIDEHLLVIRDVMDVAHILVKTNGDGDSNGVSTRT
jgi:hypothetical protein